MVTDRRIRPTAGQDEEPAYRILSHNIEAEQGLLDALMLDNSALERVSNFLRPFHFFIPVHQRLYEAILKLTERGQIAGPVTLKNYFEKDDDLKHVGGTEYLADLAAGVITIVNAEDYGRSIYDLYMRRELIVLCREVLRDAYEPRLEQERGAITGVTTGFRSLDRRLGGLQPSDLRGCPTTKSLNNNILGSNRRRFRD